MSYPYFVNMVTAIPLVVDVPECDMRSTEFITVDFLIDYGIREEVVGLTGLLP